MWLSVEAGSQAGGRRSGRGRGCRGPLPGGGEAEWRLGGEAARRPGSRGSEAAWRLGGSPSAPKADRGAVSQEVFAALVHDEDTADGSRMISWATGCTYVDPKGDQPPYCGAAFHGRSALVRHSTQDSAARVVLQVALGTKVVKPSGGQDCHLAVCFVVRLECG